MGKTGLLRIFLPKRKQTTLNLCLFIVLLFMLSFIALREWMNNVERLPIEKGRIWPKQLPAEVHVRPDPNAEMKGPGEMGAGVELEGKEKEMGDADMKKWFMNVVASDKISLDRSLPDKRMEECKSIHYSSSQLPKASVVIIFTDEAWSPLLRTVHSVINRTPPELLQEVVLLDDFSQRKELKEKLDTYIERFEGKVRLVRKKERQGLIRAKLAGAMEAKGEVVVFWTVTVKPIMDGGFWWSLHFRWDPIPAKFLASRKSPADPIPSPTMAGGLLAANRQYFLEVWMCGGSIEFIPCSHVGHIFRGGHPYDMTGPGGNKDVHGTNSKRLAEVWMDDYKRLYYLHRNDLRHKDVGNLTARHELRERLKCKSFKWYLDNVIPDKFIPDENVLGYGAFRNPETGLCLDTLQKDENSNFNLGVFGCQGGGSSAQVFSLTKSNQFRREINCLNVEFPNKRDPKSVVAILKECSKNAQTWKLGEDGLMKNEASGLCMDVAGAKNSDNLPMKECDSRSVTQKWEFVYGSS